MCFMSVVSASAFGVGGLYNMWCRGQCHFGG